MYVVFRSYQDFLRHFFVMQLLRIQDQRLFLVYEELIYSENRCEEKGKTREIVKYFWLKGCFVSHKNQIRYGQHPLYV